MLRWCCARAWQLYLLSAANMYFKQGRMREAGALYATLRSMPLTAQQAEMVQAKQAGEY